MTGLARSRIVHHLLLKNPLPSKKSRWRPPQSYFSKNSAAMRMKTRHQCWKRPSNDRQSRSRHQRELPPLLWSRTQQLRKKRFLPPESRNLQASPFPSPHVEREKQFLLLESRNL